MLLLRSPRDRVGKSGDGGNVHHVDGDYTNDAPENLVIAHDSCHKSWHAERQEQSAETRAKRAETLRATLAARGYPQEIRERMSEAQRGKIVSAATRIKISSATAGVEKSPEHVEKVARALRGRPKPKTVCVCGMTVVRHHMPQHIRSGHTKWELDDRHNLNHIE